MPFWCLTKKFAHKARLLEVVQRRLVLPTLRRLQGVNVAVVVLVQLAEVLEAQTLL